MAEHVAGIAFEQVERRAVLVGAVALAVCLAGAVAVGRGQFLHAYLTAYLFWAGIALGSLALLMLHHLVGGRWGHAIQRVLEAAVATLPLVALLFLPVLFNLEGLYVWARPGIAEADHLIHHKARYLNVPFFVGRSVFYFAVWIGLGLLLRRWSLAQDRTGEGGLTRRLQVLSGPGLVLYGLTMSFAAVDWVMSIEPHWFSTIYGVIFIVGQGLSALAFAIVVTRQLAERPPLQGAVGPNQYHDLGNLLLAFVMLWAYIAFSQYLIIWSGNMPEEIIWYTDRMAGGWRLLAFALIGLHFIVPFLLLLSRATKRRMRMLFAVASGILVMRVVDLFWIVSPAFHPKEWGLHWLDLVAPIGLGGIWLAAFVRQLKRHPLLPLRDPRFAGQAEDTRHSA
jgi:hypothetical protein